MDDWAEGLPSEAWAEYTQRMKFPLFTALLGIVFGPWGAHRFYLGQWEKGCLYFFASFCGYTLLKEDDAVYLLFCLPILIFWLIDLFRYETLTKQYNEDLKIRLKNKYRYKSDHSGDGVENG